MYIADQMNRSNWEDLFPNHYEYPSNPMLLNGPNDGDCFEYVSHQYLNGFVNYLDIMGGFVLRRYQTEDFDYQASIKELSDNPHSDFGKIGDDVILIGKGASSHWVLWYDQDVSDCQIARTKVQMTDLEFYSFVKDYYENCGSGYGPVIELPDSRCWSGWRSFETLKEKD